MIEINLLPEELRSGSAPKSSFLPKISPQKALKYFIFLFIIGQVLLTAFSFVKQLELGIVKAQVASLKQKQRAILQKKAELDAQRARLKLASTLMTRPFLWSRTLNALSNSVTKGVWLRSISVGESGQTVVAKKKEPESASGEAPKKKKKEVPTKGEKPVKKKKSSKEEAKPAVLEKTYTLKIEGSVVAKGEETAYIGRFIKELKSDPVFSELFDTIELSTILQKKIRDVDVYDFVVMCSFKRAPKALAGSKP